MAGGVILLAAGIHDHHACLAHIALQVFRVDDQRVGLLEFFAAAGEQGRAHGKYKHQCQQPGNAAFGNQTHEKPP